MFGEAQKKCDGDQQFTRIISNSTKGYLMT